MPIKDIYIIHILLLILYANNIAAQDYLSLSTKHKIDSTLERINSSLYTDDCINHIASLEAFAKENSTHKFIHEAYRLKAKHLYKTGQLRKAHDFIDSLETYTDIATTNPRCHSDILLTRGCAYLSQSHYRLAINIAQQLFAASDGYESAIFANDNDIENAPVTVINRIRSLRILSAANFYMERYEEAKRFLNEGIKIATQYPYLFFQDLIAMQTLRMQCDIQTSTNHMQALASIDRFNDELLLHKKYRPDPKSDDFSELQASDLNVHLCYIDIYYRLGRSFATQAQPHINALRAISQDPSLVKAHRSNIYKALSQYYQLIGENVMSIAYSDSAATICRELNDMESERDVLTIRLEACHAAHLNSLNYETAKRILSLSDSINSEIRHSTTDEISILMERDKLNTETQRIEVQRIIWIVALVTILFVTAIIVFIVLHLQHKKNNIEKERILSQQKDLLQAEVTRQTSELLDKNRFIEHANREMTDSINYAQHIQSAILPDLTKFKGNGIADAFVFFLPYKIVSGDFYWARQHNDTLLFACADCTGHGVPGAFMSMIGTTILNDICSQNELPDASQILSMLDHKLIEILDQGSHHNIQDGMDIALIAYNSSTRQLQVSSARRPVYLFVNGTLQEIKGVKRSIGDRDDKSRTLPYTDTTLTMSPGDAIYMCSDGLSDQFGGQQLYGPSGKRLRSVGLLSLLNNLYRHPFSQQCHLTEHLYYEWRGTCPQVDDISLIGIQF